MEVTTIDGFQVFSPLAYPPHHIPKGLKVYVSLRLRMQNAVSTQPCVGKFRISLVLLNFLHCNFRLWFETP